MSSRANVEKNYPNLFDPNLPLYLDCPKDQEIKEAKKGFNRICPKNAIIVAVEGFDANCEPACVWRVYYQKKNEEYDYEEDCSNSHITAPELPKDEASLLDFYENLTNKIGYLDLAIARKYKTADTAVVEYFPRACECNVQNFSQTSEEPRMWSIKEAEINLEKLKIHL